MSSQTLRIFGNRLRMLRHKQGVSQEELGRRAGLHRTYIGMLERGEKNVTLMNLQKLAKAFGVSISDLTDFE